MSLSPIANSFATLLPVPRDVAVRLLPAAVSGMGWQISEGRQSDSGQWRIELADRKTYAPIGASLLIDSRTDRWSWVQLRSCPTTGVPPANHDVFLRRLTELSSPKETF